MRWHLYNYVSLTAVNQNTITVVLKLLNGASNQILFGKYWLIIIKVLMILKLIKQVSPKTRKLDKSQYYVKTFDFSYIRIVFNIILSKKENEINHVF